MASEDDVIIEVIGPDRDLYKATLIIAAENVMYVMLMSKYFLEVSVPGWEEGIYWMVDNMDRSIDRAVATSVGRRLVGMELSSVTGLFTLVVEAR